MAEALAFAIPDTIDALAREVLEMAGARGLLLASAESCTGGLLASLLTDIPGRSHAFERGFVVYTDAAKHELLGVPLDLLRTEGAVSAACAEAMARGALARSRADIAAAITGFAEAGSEPGEAAGLVHLATAGKEGSLRRRTLRLGDIGRARVRLEALRAALEMMHKDLEG